MKKTIAICFVLGALLSGCYYDNYKELYPAASLSNLCDTVDSVTYNKIISPIMNSYCIGCHSASIANGNVALDTYSGVMSAATNGQLTGSLLDKSGYPAMPPNSQLDQCSLREVELWIQNNYAQ